MRRYVTEVVVVTGWAQRDVTVGDHDAGLGWLCRVRVKGVLFNAFKGAIFAVSAFVQMVQGMLCSTF